MISVEKFKEYIRTLNPRIFKSHKITKIHIEELPKGNWNYNFLVTINNNKFVFKIYSRESKGFFVNSGEKEYDSLNLLKEVGIAPIPVLFDGTKSFFNNEVLVYEFVEGKRVSRFDEEVIIKIAKILGKLHSLNINNARFLDKKIETTKILLEDSIDLFINYKKRKDAIIEYVKNLETIIEKLKKRKVIELPYSPAIIHTDLVSGNFIINDFKEIYLIDWQTPKFGDPAFDVWAITNRIYNQWDSNSFINEKGKKIFLEEYSRYNKDWTLLERIKIKEPLWLLSLCLYCLIRYTDFISGKIGISRDRIKNFERYKKVLESGITALNILIQNSKKM